MNMTDTLVSFETAKLAKEKGFPITEKGFYIEGVFINRGFSKDFHKWYKDDSLIQSAPTQSLLQRWLREEHNIHIGGEVRWNNFENEEIIYEFWIKDMREVKPSKRIFTEPSCLSYEGALEKGLQEGLKLIK